MFKKYDFFILILMTHTWIYSTTGTDQPRFQPKLSSIASTLDTSNKTLTVSLALSACCQKHEIHKILKNLHIEQLSWEKHTLQITEKGFETREHTVVDPLSAPYMPTFNTAIFEVKHTEKNIDLTFAFLDE